jgi:type II secretory pathway pseudopilin PulG
MKRGITLIELTIVLGIIVLLAGLSLPAIRAFNDSVTSGSINTINVALNTAREIARSTQTYTGVRFQRSNDDVQYAIFIVYRPELTAEDDPGLVCTALKGRKPISLGQRYSVLAEDSNAPAVIFAANGQACRRVYVVVPNPDLTTPLFGNSFTEDINFQQSQLALLINDESSPYYVNRYTAELIRH